MARMQKRPELWEHWANVSILTWPELRDIAVSHGKTTCLRYVQVGNRVTVWLPMDGNILFVTAFNQGHAHHTEFTGSYQPGIVNPITQTGLNSVTVMDTPDGIVDYRKSWEYDAQPGWNIWDISVDSMALGSNAVYLRGGEYRVFGPASKGSKLTFTLVDRDDVFGLFPLYGVPRTKLTGLTGVSGVWAVGDQVVGNGGAIGDILAVGADFLEIKASFSGTWVDGEPLTSQNTSGVSTGATATLGAYSEGGFIELVRSLDEDSIRDGDTGTMRPGGAKKLIAGTYFRVSCYNAAASVILEFRATLELGR